MSFTTMSRSVTIPMRWPPASHTGSAPASSPAMRCAASRTGVSSLRYSGASVITSRALVAMVPGYPLRGGAQSRIVGRRSGRRLDVHGLDLGELVEQLGAVAQRRATDAARVRRAARRAAPDRVDLDRAGIELGAGAGRVLL